MPCATWQRLSPDAHEERMRRRKGYMTRMSGISVGRSFPCWSIARLLARGARALGMRRGGQV